MRIAVTGAAGFVGRNLVARLAAARHDVRAIVRTQAEITGAWQIVAASDLENADHRALFTGCDAVVNCAARVHVMRRETPGAALTAFRRANRDMAVGLAEAARGAGVRRFIQLSSMAAVTSVTAPGEVIDDATSPHPDTPYGISKREADDAMAGLAETGFSVCSLRPPAVYGAGVGAWFALLMRAARAGLPLPVGAIENARSFIFVGNLADAVARLIEADPMCGAYLVTDSAPLSTAALYRRLLHEAGKPDRAWAWPAWLVRGGASAALRGRTQSLLGNAACSGARFAAHFDWTPPVEFDDAIAVTMKHR